MAPYFIRSLVPRREMRQGNPLWTCLKEVTLIQWAQFLSGWLAWICDANDFFSVSLSVTNLEKTFNRSAHDITTAITLTLLFRSIGAIVFGVVSDRFGRKWPLVINLLVVCMLEIGTSFIRSFYQFLALRSLFGVAMGGIWGLAASTALENLPVEVRGLASGVVQQGYAIGYLVAAVGNLTLVPHSSHGWRILFLLASGYSMFAAILRALLPESAVFLRAKEMEKARGTNTSEKTKMFMQEIKTMLKTHWMLCIYAVLLMTGFNFLSHGSQDLYPTYLQISKGFTPHDASIATIIGTTGAISGGAFAGYISQYIGRRLTIIIFVTLVGAFIPLWIIPSTFSALAAGAFCVQFGVQGAWGVIPIQLAEMSPPAFRATFPGVAYQLGNMMSAASAQIEAFGGDNLKITIMRNGKPTVVPDYAKVQGMLLGVIAVFVIIITLVGPENHSSHFENAKTAFEEGGGKGEMENPIGVSVNFKLKDISSSRDMSLGASEDDFEKARIEHLVRVK